MSVQKEAKNVAMVGGALSLIGWVVVAVAAVLGAVLWIQFAAAEAFNIIEAFRISLNAIIASLTGGLLLAGLGSTMKLLAAYTTSRS